MVDNPEQLRSALLDHNEIIHFALSKLDIWIDAEGAKRISEVGLEWLAYAALHPENPNGFASKAQTKLEP